MIKIDFLTSGSEVEIPEEANLLRTSIRYQGGIPFKCGAGACGTCKCRVDRGIENTDKIKPREHNHITEEEFAQGYRLACQTFVKKGEIAVSWIPLDKRTPKRVTPVFRPRQTKATIE